MSSKRLSDGSEGAMAQPAAITLSFRDIRYTVKSSSTGEQLDILKGCSGKVEPNRLTAIMGSSGAGKTTLLDVLACNLFGGGTATGEVLVNGAPRRRQEFSKIACYVQQRDVLLPSATVRESLMVAALLKLPRGMSKAEKVARVDETLQELELEGCQNTLIGDELLGMKGISGGQRRRVSVGIELVQSPRVLFLDEPTSGLDSEMAVSLCDTLLRLARQNRTVCTTIHQPNSYITAKFDEFMLLHAGSVAYFGLWADSVDYFASQGCPCPQYTNPSDYFMSVLKERGDELVEAWDKQEQCKHADQLAAIEAGEAPEEADVAGGDGQPAQGLQMAPRVPWFYQVQVLGGRMLKMWWRNPAMLASEAAQYAFLALFVGLVYLQVNNSIATGVNDRAASLWFAMAVLSFTPGYTAATIWDKDRLMLRRETRQGMYGTSSWFFARTVTTWPVELVQTFLFCTVMYWMVGYAANFGAFMIFVAAFCLFQLISETVGTACAILSGNATYAVILETFVLLFLLSFSGFLVSDVPVYFRWISKISYLTYAYSAVMSNEFTRVTFYEADGTPVPGSEILNGTYDGGLSFASVNNGLSVAENIWVLLGIAIGTRALCFFLLWGMMKLRRL